MMRSNDHKHPFTLSRSKAIAGLLVIATLAIAFTGYHLLPAHAMGPTNGVDPNPQDASSLSTNAPDSCFNTLQSQLNGSAPQQFVSIPNVGQIEIDDTVYSNGCSKAFASNVFMSGLVYVHWSTLNSALGNAPTMTVTLQSQAKILGGVDVSWNLNGGVNAGVSAGTGSAPGANAGANATLGFTVSPNDSTIVSSTATITGQQSATFSYQNLEATATSGIDGNVVQNDAITIVVESNEQQTYNVQVETPFS